MERPGERTRGPDFGGMRSLLVLAIAFGASLLGSMSGGSASALSTPAWLALGVPLPTAIATDKLAAALWTLLGARNLLRQKVVDWPLLAGKRVGLIVCGTNIAPERFAEHLARGVELLNRRLDGGAAG